MSLTPLHRNLLAAAITGVGCLQMVGYLLDAKALRGLGSASTIAPFPKVFSDVDGLETFASTFELKGVDGSGKPFLLMITPELYQQLKGPYNRRNVYGAALSYAPRMPEPLWTSVYCYAFSPAGPLRRDFALPQGASQLAVTIRTKTRGRNDVWVLAPACAQ